MKLSGDTHQYYIWTGEATTGPYTPEALESLVYLGKLTPETLACRVGEQTYTPLRETELGPVLFPRLKETSQPRDWGRPGQADNAGRHQRQDYQFTETKFNKINAAPGTHHPIEVTDLLDEIRQSEVESGRDLIGKTSFKFSKRSRDFWFMLIVGNAVLLGGGIALHNMISLVFGLAGSGLFTFGLVWSMYGVMDRY